MPDFNSDISSVTDGDSQRRETPFQYIPRWTDAASEDTVKTAATDPFSKLTDLYATAIAKPLEVFQNIELIAKFYQSTSYARNAYVAEGAYNNSEPMQISLTNLGSGHVSTIKIVDDLDTLSSMKYTPCAVLDNHALVLRCIDLTEGTLTTNSSGYLDFNSIFTTQPRIEDSPLWISNIYGDVTEFSPQEIILSNNILTPEFNGSYRYRYSSEILRTAVLNGDITINTNVTSLHQFDLPNLVDEYANDVGIKRYSDESNLSLLARCQNTTLSLKPQDFISSELGTAVSVLWNSGISLSVSGSVGGTVSFASLPHIRTVEETPAYIDDTLYLSSTPSFGYCTITAPGVIFDPESYTVSSNTILLLTDDIKATEKSTLKVQYSISTFSLTTAVSGININADQLNPALFYGVIPEKIKISGVSKTIYDMVWGISADYFLDSSDFE